MRVLLIGASGQVGTEVRRQAENHGVNIYAPDRASFDLAKPETLRYEVATGGYGGVINAAAYTAVDQAETEPQIARLVNTESAEQVALGCADVGIPLVHYSTDYVFNGEGVSPYKENDLTSPAGVYGLTKRDGEQLVRASGANAAIVRLSWVFSSVGKNFVKTMLSLAQTKGALNVVADQYGKPTPASAAAEAGLVVLRELSEDPNKAGIYQFCGVEETNWADFARAIFNAAGLSVVVSDISTDQYPTPARRPAYSVMCSDAITSKFGIAAPDWREHLLRVILELQKENEAEQ